MDIFTEKDGDAIGSVTSLKIFDNLMLTNGKCYTVSNAEIEDRASLKVTLGCTEAPDVNDAPVIDLFSTIDFYGIAHNVTGINTTGWSNQARVTLTGLK